MVNGTVKPTGLLPNAFIGKLTPPSDKELAAKLGTAKPLWDRLLSDLASEHRLVVREWSSRSAKAGWSLRMMRRERNIVYLSPSHACFLASFALGAKAIEAARASELPKSVLKTIAEARKYAEGTAVRIQVRTAEDVAAVIMLAGIKLDN
jgi:hypothetical protein